MFLRWFSLNNDSDVFKYLPSRFNTINGQVTKLAILNTQQQETVLYMSTSRYIWQPAPQLKTMFAKKTMAGMIRLQYMSYDTMYV